MRRITVAMAAAAAMGVPAMAEPFVDFVFNPAQSGFDGTLNLGVETSGTLIGDFDPDTNPSGTRTKPGLFGSFGPTENVPVPVDLGVTVGGPAAASISGSMRLAFNFEGDTVRVSGYAAAWGQGAIGVPATLSLDPDSFRTRSPESIFPGLPIDLPIGEILLSDLSMVQTGEGASGTLASRPGGFDYQVTVPVLLFGNATLFGQTVEIPGVPLAIPLDGSVDIEGQNAELFSQRSFTEDGSATPGLQLPTFPLDLPTVLPPGETASLLFSLELDNIFFALSGMQTLESSGVVIPAPGGAAVLILAGLVGVRRRC